MPQARSFCESKLCLPAALAVDSPVWRAELSTSGKAMTSVKRVSRGFKWMDDREKRERERERERGFCLLKGIAEGTYNTKHAEAARLYYTTIPLCYYTTTLALKSSGTGTRRRSRPGGGRPGLE